MPAQQGQQCPFCQLVANPEQTFDVHETEHFKAWLDINPRARGHTMIVPKEHWTSMDEIGEHVPELFEMVQIVMEKAKNGLDADGVSVVLNEGEAGGQNLDHFYVQVFPRFQDEENAGAPAGAVFQPIEDLEQDDLEDISEKMANASFDGGGKPSKSGAASKMIKSNRGDSQSLPTQNVGSQRAQAEKQEGSQNGSGEDEDEGDEESDEQDEETRARGDHWDGESYSWDRDGAEFK